MYAFAWVSMGALFAALCAGCTSTEQRSERPAEAASPSTEGNGLHLNGLHLNGLHLNGLHLNGIHLNGIHLNGVSLCGTRFSGALPCAAALSDQGLVGTQIDGTLSDGSAIVARVDGVRASSDPDVLFYTVSYKAPGGTSQPLCGADAGGKPIEAVPLAGTWDESEGTPTGGAHTDDPGLFTFACEGYALAKCVNFGYAPWRTAKECDATGACHDLSLAPFHQACTRMLRADYCGDGTSTTRDGTLVDTWDPLGLQTDDAPTWKLEAEWSPGGAVCVEQTRWPTILDEGISVRNYIRDHCEERWQTPGCGGAGSTFFTANGYSAPLATRALLRTRVADQP